MLLVSKPFKIPHLRPGKGLRDENCGWGKGLYFEGDLEVASDETRTGESLKICPSHQPVAFHFYHLEPEAVKVGFLANLFQPTPWIVIEFFQLGQGSILFDDHKGEGQIGSTLFGFKINVRSGMDPPGPKSFSRIYLLIPEMVLFLQECH